MSDSERPINMTESVDIALKEHQGKVVMHWYQPRNAMVFEPDSAFAFAEHLARAAHRAKFPGERMPEDFSYLAQQVKQRLTDEMRDRLAVRVRTALPSLLERKDLNYAAVQIVDSIFSALDDQGFYKL
jgi:hypothetical protein